MLCQTSAVSQSVNRRICLVFLVVTTACAEYTAGGSANDGVSSVPSGGTGAAATSPVGGATEASGGSTAQSTSGFAGATSSGGSSATVATTCVADNICPSEGVFPGDFAVGPSIRGCRSDSDCLAGDFCGSVGAHQCTCGPNHRPDGSLFYFIVYDISVPACQPSRCANPVSLAFTSQLGSGPCDVVVRVNADGSTILGYKVVCGAAATVTQGALLSTLQSTSGAAWQGAMGYGDTSKHFLFVDNSNPNHAIAFSGVTGLQLFEFTDSNVPMVLGDWSNASELDGSCNYGYDVGSFVTLGPWQGSYPGNSVVRRIDQQGVFSGISTASGGERSVTLVHAGLPSEEFIVIISTSPRI